MFSDSVVAVFSNIAVVAGGIIAVAALWRKVIVPASRRFKSTLDRFDKIDEVLKELKPNGGTSLRDGVNRIELVTQDLTSHLERHDKKLDRMSQVQWALAQDVRCGVFETDRLGVFIRVNQQFSRLVGRNQEECTGNNWIHCIHESDRERVLEEWNSAIRFRRNMDTVCRVVHSDGHTFGVVFKATTLFDTLAGKRRDEVENALPDVSGWIGSINKVPETLKPPAGGTSMH